MKAGSMEGLIGASVNMKLSQTPMRVFKEAERKGDTAVMERAMGYVTDFQEKAHECSDRAQEELAKELKEERKEQELKRQQALERKEETKEYVEKIRENNKPDIPETISIVENADVKMYTSEGKTISLEQAVESNNKKIDITL